MQSEALRGWRRVASAMWPAPRDPQIYAQLEIDAGPLQDFIGRAGAAGYHVTPTHLVARGVVAALEAVPELNVRIFGSRFIPRPRIEVFFIAAMYGPRDDLSGVKLDLTDRTAIDVATELERTVGALREGRDGKDASFERTKQLTDRLPRPVLRAALHLTALLTQTFQLQLPLLSLARSPFGSAIISSVGSLGIESGFAPLSWLYDVPLLILIGEVNQRARVVDGQVVARPVLPLSVTIDHRYVDGIHLSRALRALQRYLEAPEAYEPGWPASAPESKRSAAGEQRR